MSGNSERIPESVCFRVTRACNARCGFCLAPPDGSHPDTGTLLGRIDWLLDRGVRSIDFCGGEPTIHPSLAELIEHAHRRGAKTKLTTNGIAIPDRLVEVLAKCQTSVKFSIHGDREHHDRMVGRAAFDRAIANLRKMAGLRMNVSIQATIVSGNGQEIVSWLAASCMKWGVRKLGIIPFIPRGYGLLNRSEYELSATARQSLREFVSQSRRAYLPGLEIRWLDFSAHPVPVMEANGQFLLEGASESLDLVIR